MKINIKHKKVVDEYIVNGRNKKQAYLSVYNKANGKTAETNSHHLFKREEVKEYLEQQEHELVLRYNISRNDLISELQFVIDSAKNETPGVTDRTAINKAIDILAKMTGAYAPQKIDNRVSFNIDLDEEDDE